MYMAKKLYVGNLPYSMTDDQLRDLFSQYGAVESAQVIVDKLSGRSKGFGFVELSNDDEAQMAIDKLNNTDVGGRVIVVNEARPLEPKTSRPGGGSGGGFNRPRFRSNNDRGMRGGSDY